MQETKVKQEDFDFTGFIQSLDPEKGYFSLKSLESIPEIHELKNLGDPYETLKNSKGYLFFPFDEELTEEDYEEYKNSDSYKSDQELSKDDEPEDEDGEQSLLDEIMMTIGDTGLPGYLFRHDKGDILIQTGCIEFSGCPGPPPSFELHEDFGVFESPMKRYIDSFIKK